MLKDSDARVRNEAANAMLEFAISQLKHTNDRMNLIAEFTAEILSNEIPFSLDIPINSLHGSKFSLNSTQNVGRPIQKVLGKCLFDLTNMIFELKSSEQLVRNDLHSVQRISTNIAKCVFISSLARPNVCFVLWKHSIQFNSWTFGANTIS